jgi:hypothetical protein
MILYYFICDDRAVYNDAASVVPKFKLTADTLHQINFQDAIAYKMLQDKI